MESKPVTARGPKLPLVMRKKYGDKKVLVFIFILICLASIVLN